MIIVYTSLAEASLEDTATNTLLAKCLARECELSHLCCAAPSVIKTKWTGCPKNTKITCSPSCTNKWLKGILNMIEFLFHWGSRTPSPFILHRLYQLYRHFCRKRPKSIFGELPTGIPKYVDIIFVNPIPQMQAWDALMWTIHLKNNSWISLIMP